LYYLDQSLKDGEEITIVKKKRDDLLWKENEACEWALELLFMAKECDRRLVVKDRLVAAKEQVCQDATTINRLRSERDESCQTVG
jgi:hypothetical protein